MKAYYTHYIQVMDHLKLINAPQASIAHAYKNRKEKVHATNAAI
jgi:hypothetical protein